MRNYNSPIDIFALGCVMAEMYNRKPLFNGNNDIEQLNIILKRLGNPLKSEWP
jgi:serine/threonine protein kinase